jgi:putative aldouronate transport system substrate-binding protein
MGNQELEAAVGNEFVVQYGFGEDHLDQGISDTVGEFLYPPGEGRAVKVPHIGAYRGLQKFYLFGKYQFGCLSFFVLYRQTLNIDLRTAWVSADYDANLNLSIASGDLPDVFSVNNNQFWDLMDAGMLEDVTDAFNQNISTDVKMEYDFAPEVLEVYKRNGRLYGFPLLYYGDIDKPYFIWYRKDWMAELGYNTDPKTINDMIGIVDAMNKKYGTKGMAEDRSLGNLLSIASMWHAAPKVWVTGSDGRIVYGSVQPEMKTALTAFNDWYKRGLINPNFATEDGDTVKADVINGKYGAQPFPQWWGWYVGGDVVNNNNKNAYFEPYQLPSVDSKPVLYPLQFPNYSTIVVRKGYKHADAVMKILNLYMFMIGTNKALDTIITQQEFYFYDEMETVMPFRFMPPTYDYKNVEDVQEFKKNGDYSVFRGSGQAEKSRSAIQFLETGDASGGALGGFLQVYADRSAYGIAKGIVDRDEFIRSKMWGLIPEDVNRYGSTLDDLLLEGFTLIILGRQPVSYFDTLVRNWYAAGGQEMTDAVNAMYR